MVNSDLDSPQSEEKVLYEATDGSPSVEVRLDQETVWLTKSQMATLFEQDLATVTKLINDIYREGELDLDATCAKFAQVASQGGRQISQQVEHYNLDVVISVGCRIHSRRGVQFRNWAIHALMRRMMEMERLTSTKLSEHESAEVRSLWRLRNELVHGRRDTFDDMSQVVSALISTYANTWKILVEFDEDRLQALPGNLDNDEGFSFELAVGVVDQFRRDLMDAGEASELFGLSQGDKFEAILGNIQQTMFNEPLYKSNAEKAAHLLYFVVKDHPFVDGNKRIASLLFLLYLYLVGVMHNLNPEAISVLALLIAESAPADKDLMIRLTINLLANGAD